MRNTRYWIYLLAFFGGLSVARAELLVHESFDYPDAAPLHGQNGAPPVFVGGC
jgi:hypothetical protein